MGRFGVGGFGRDPFSGGEFGSGAFGVGNRISFVSGSMTLHLDTNFADSSSNNVTVTASGVTISTGQPKFGAGSALFVRASSQSLSFPDSAIFQVGAGDFQIDFWTYLSNVTNNQYFLSDSNAGATAFSININVGGGGPGVVILQINNAAATIIHQNTMSINTQTHIMVKCVSGVITLYLAGVASSSTISGATISSNQASGNWYIGKTGLNNSNYVDGYIDEFHWFKGISALPSPNPPTSPYS